ncbi:hypothetical protein CW689_01395 [Macrococcoides caseolyticum]|uniref:hypothetical protein n=1 Tax=Macrococcoides caseolyticum TaxID=69966 RepID=UPI000C32FEEF|nr:hypothetical protein [Macrococcus caseolyticus]PKE25147.1 hypothetical protein CW689_01395 [Macrococcus caseolyticus]
MEKSKVCQMLLFFKHPESAKMGLLSEEQFYVDLGYMVQEGYLDGNINLDKTMSHQSLNFHLTQKGEKFLEEQCE